MSRAVGQRARASVEVVCFPIVAAVYAIHLFASGYDRFYYDSAVYWQLGDRFERNGHFSLFAYRDLVGGYSRGYSLPLLNHVLHVVGSAVGMNDVTVVKVFGALLAATLGVVVAPRLARELFPAASIGIGSVLALNALVFVFWRDHFDFPLSDFPALLLACVGTIGLLRAGRWGYVVAGVCFGLAANMRPAYLPALLVAVLAAGLRRRGSWDARRQGAAAALVLVGAFAAFLPQMAINHHQRGSWSPMTVGGKFIALLQLTDGMIAQKYETYVGPSAEYPTPQVFYLDPATRNVLEKQDVQRVTSYGQYARIVLHDPAEMAASYVRHVFNGIDVRYPTPYIRDLGDSSVVLSILLYTLVFAALVRLLLPSARRALGPIRWIGVVLLLSPIVTAVPGAVEPRFFLPLQLLVYMLVCFAPAPLAGLVGSSIRHRATLAVAYAAFVLLCLTLSSATLSHLQHPGPTLGIGTTVSR